MNRTAGGVLVTAAVAGVVLLGGTDRALACSCVPADATTALARADVAFAGTAVAVEAPGPATTGAPVVWTFSVDTVVKGAADVAQRVVTPRQSATCGYAFEIGRRYLVLAGTTDGVEGAHLATGLCSGTHEVTPGEDVNAPVPAGIPRVRFPVYWLGDAFEDAPLIGATRRGPTVTLTYGTCLAGTCHTVVRVMTTHTCTRPSAGRAMVLTGRGPLRGVPAGRRGGARVLMTGRERVVLAGGSAATRRAAAELTSVDGVITAGARLPAPAAGAARRVPCGTGSRAVAVQAAVAPCPLVSEP